MKLTVNSDPALHDCLGKIRAAYRKHPFIRVSITSGKKRSLDANAIQWVWMQQISAELGEDSPEGVQNECKLNFGVPILLAEDEKFREFWKKLDHLDYESKLAAMRYVPITREFTTDQMRRYLDEVQRAYAKRGVILESE